MKEYIVYIVRCRDKAYYTGITNDIERRVAEHNEGADEKCFTYKRRPVTLVYQYAFREVNDAISAEKQLKGWSRRKKEALIQGRVDLLPGLSSNAMQRKIRSRRSMAREHFDVTLRLGSG